MAQVNALWFVGSVAEAIASARARACLLAVFVAGEPRERMNLFDSWRRIRKGWKLCLGSNFCFICR